MFLQAGQQRNGTNGAASNSACWWRHAEGRAVLSTGQDHVLGVQSKDREDHVARTHVVLHVHHKVSSSTFNRTGNKPWFTFSCTLWARFA